MTPSRQQILEYILSTLGDLCRDWDYAEEVGPSTGLFAQLGMESLDAVVLATSIQDHFGHIMPFSELFAELGEQQRDLTVAELVDFIHASLGEPVAKSVTEAAPR